MVVVKKKLASPLKKVVAAIAAAPKINSTTPTSANVAAVKASTVLHRVALVMPASAYAVVIP